MIISTNINDANTNDNNNDNDSENDDDSVNNKGSSHISICLTPRVNLISSILTYFLKTICASTSLEIARKLDE